MLTDRENDVVSVSDRLQPTHPALVDRLRGILGSHGIDERTIRGTSDVWCRDFMPIEVGLLVAEGQGSTLRPACPETRRSNDRQGR